MKKLILIGILVCLLTSTGCMDVASYENIWWADGAHLVDGEMQPGDAPPYNPEE